MVSLRTSPWSSNAKMTGSGMVLTVPGAIRSSTYMTSRYSGFFVEVDAHSGRCGCAPASAPAAGRGVPAAGGQALGLRLVREPGIGDRGLALQRLGLVAADLVEPLVDLGVHARDEERRDRPDLGEGGA